MLAPGNVTNEPEVAGDDGPVAAPQFPRTRRPAHATGQPGQTVSVNLAGTGTGTGTRVLIEVWDADPRPPGPGEPGEGGTSDGVLLVAALSARWDWYPKPPVEIVTDLDILRRLLDRLRS